MYVLGVGRVLTHTRSLKVRRPSRASLQGLGTVGHLYQCRDGSGLSTEVRIIQWYLPIRLSQAQPAPWNLEPRRKIRAGSASLSLAIVHLAQEESLGRTAIITFRFRLFNGSFSLLFGVLGIGFCHNDQHPPFLGFGTV